VITSEQINLQSSDERGAWIASLNDDESTILHCAVGRRYTLVFISLVKYLLAREIPTSNRLEFLEWLDRRDGEWLSREMIAAIDPMDDDGYELLREAMKLGAKKALDVVARWEVFSAFVALNPSLLTAIKMPNYSRRNL
jgi:hypothetical protein